jgi:outer membrane protein OmpA-like peptidoglycan-associated protein
MIKLIVMTSPPKPGSFNVILLIAFILLDNTAVAADQSPTNYVVIGAFSHRDNAVRFTDKARSDQLDAKFDMNPARQLYYVFVMQTPDKEGALTEAMRLRKESSFIDAWVFFGVLGEMGSGVDLNPVTQQNIEPMVTQEPTPGVIVPVVETPKETPKDEALVGTTPEVKPEDVLPTNTVANDPKAVLKDFYFKVIRDDGTAANGAEITVIDLGSQKKEYVLEGNKNVSFKAVNQTGDIRLECDLVGYRKVVHNLNFKDPGATDGVTIENDRITVPFELIRLKKGDHSILYNVFFYKDAAIMRAESKFDLDGLLAMMNENPKYKIRIHGHTNGSAAGKILEVGESGNFFSLTGAREGGGSAKKLSEKRALVIQQYLAKEGVDAARMSVKAWGGKKPLYDKHHTQASSNVRVEVEVVEE